MHKDGVALVGVVDRRLDCVCAITLINIYVATITVYSLFDAICSPVINREIDGIIAIRHFSHTWLSLQVFASQLASSSIVNLYIPFPLRNHIDVYRRGGQIVKCQLRRAIELLHSGCCVVYRHVFRSHF